jgi:hypothetical protein
LGRATEKVEEKALEERLQAVIEGWQRKFYEEYVEPKIRCEFEHISNQIKE